MSQTKIEWAETVWNPVTGCSKVSPGCVNCYAERMSKRLAGRCGYPKDEPFRVTLHPDKLEEPYKWKKPRRIFVCSMADLFHEDVPDEFIFQVFNSMAKAQWIYGHKFMVLTKRPERMKAIIQAIEANLAEQRKPIKNPNGTTMLHLTFSFPLQTVWLGVTAENQEMADQRIPILLQIPAAVHWVSCEPLIGPVNIELYLRESGLRAPHWLDWCVAGGESGPGARPMHPSWAKSLRDQCQAVGVPYFFKQWGEWAPFYDRDKDDPDWQNIPEEKPGICRLNLAGGRGFHGERVVYFHRVGKKTAGRLLDGRTWDQLPKAGDHCAKSAQSG